MSTQYPHPAPGAPQPYQPPPQPEKKSWLREYWKLATLLAIILVIAVASIGSNDTEPAQVAASTSASTSANESSTASSPNSTSKKTTHVKPRKTTEPKPAHQRVTSREWSKIAKNPDAHEGDRIIIYGQVTQFDSATGDDQFRAEVAHRNTMSYGFFDGKNTILFGTAKQLDDLVEDDVFRAAVTVRGSYDYDTQIGGETTAPVLKVDSIKIIG